MNQIFKNNRTSHSFRWVEAFLLLVSVPVIFISITPILYAILWGLCGTGTPGTLGDFTKQWLVNFLSDKEWIRSFGFSLSLSVMASSGGLFLIANTDYFSRLSQPAYEKLSASIILLALLFPQVVYGIALRYFLGITHIPSIVGLFVANVVLLLPVQYLLIVAGHSNLTSVQLQAATVLGASPYKGLIHVYIPLMLKPLTSAWLIGFLMALDELVIAMFVWDAPVQPLSKRLWGLFGRSSEPIPGVITIVVICTLCAVVFLLLGTHFIHRLKNKQK